MKLFKGVSKKAELFGDDERAESDQWEVSEIIDHRGLKAAGRKASTLEYFVHWANFNIEDYTWEKEADVVAKGKGAGANELVAEYWERRHHLDARAVSTQSRAAENLNEGAARTAHSPANSPAGRSAPVARWVSLGGVAEGEGSRRGRGRGGGGVAEGEGARHWRNRL